MTKDEQKTLRMPNVTISSDMAITPEELNAWAGNGVDLTDEWLENYRRMTNKV